MAENWLRGFSHPTPDIKILMMSGYTEEAIHRQGSPLPGIAFMEKPFTAQQLTIRVREVLDDSRGSRKQLSREA